MKSPWAAPLMPLYQAGSSAERFLYTHRLLPVRALRKPVISVGSISAGGAGKTPFVMALAHLLSEKGLSVDILSRGYGRRSGLIEEVDPSGDANRFGDEPLELAQHGFNVFVGADRFAAGKLAERSGSADLHLLDDGFQHRSLERALDIALLTSAEANDCLLPAGNLREPLSALRRADIVVVRSEEAAALRPLIAQRTNADVWTIVRSLSLPDAMPQRPVVFCAIARPENFVDLLRSRGVQPACVVQRRDHHAWNQKDISTLINAARASGADGFVTTAKDAVKVGPAAASRLKSSGLFAVAGLHVSLLDPDSIFATVSAVLDIQNQRSSRSSP